MAICVIFTLAFAGLTALSMVLLAWQVIAAHRFPLHQREVDPSHAPAMLVLKPLKGCDEHTADCLRSWLRQKYPGHLRILFGVAEETDPVCDLVRCVLKEFPEVDAMLVPTPNQLGPNAKISNVAQLYAFAERSGIRPGNGSGAGFADFALPLVCISDADVRIPMDFLVNAVASFRDPAVGLVTGFYQFPSPRNFAMQLEAISVNADFWSQVLQSNTLKPQNFALGAVMITRSEHVALIGGFEALTDYLADDYQLGYRVAKAGFRVVLARVVAECWDSKMSLRQVWIHQKRWARTIRAQEPLPYALSILNNVLLWVTLFAISGAALSLYRVAPGYPWHMDIAWIRCSLLAGGLCLLARLFAVQFLVQRLTQRRLGWRSFATVVARDYFGAAIWAAAFLGNTVMWRGRTFRIVRGGRLVEFSQVLVDAR